MQRDISDTPLYREAEELFGTLLCPGTGQISDAAEINVSPDGKHAVFAGTIVDKLEGAVPTRICQVDLRSAQTRVLTFGPNADRLPKFSPDGQRIAFLSDRHRAGDFQLFILDPVSGAARAAPRVDGWVEYLHWSPDGARILLGVAGHGADISSGQGAITSQQVTANSPTWMPAVETGDESYRWRRAWVYELAIDSVRVVSNPSVNIWEATWCGDDSLLAVISPGPGEGLWYSARLHVLDLATGGNREIHKPKDQLGWPAASPSGRRLAFVEAICSDRWFVAGDLQLVDRESGRTEKIDTLGVDISCTEWRSDDCLLVAGHRGFETVVGLYDANVGRFTEVWASQEIGTGGRFVSVAGLNEVGDCAMVGESFTRPPEIALVRAGQYASVKSFDLGYANQAKSIASVECMSWTAPDGMEIQGWLLRPEGRGPHPVALYIHGGPVWLWHPFSLCRGRYVAVLMLLCRGYAIFLPNPRGSSGRGQAFARCVVGDMGGADTFDYLSGLDQLVDRGIADVNRLGVAGLSYGGFMTSWLITQDQRFAAAVAVSPHTNQVTERLLSNIPQFMDLFLADRHNNPGGKYFDRSSIMHAHKARTPTLNICGALDRCTPPEEAMQFHNALVENGVTSVLVTYPEEGHGIQKWPALIDYAARVVSWFEQHMPSIGNAG